MSDGRRKVVDKDVLNLKRHLLNNQVVIYVERAVVLIGREKEKDSVLVLRSFRTAYRMWQQRS